MLAHNSWIHYMYVLNLLTGDILSFKERVWAVNTYRGSELIYHPKATLIRVR